MGSAERCEAEFLGNVGFDAFGPLIEQEHHTEFVWECVVSSVIISAASSEGPVSVTAFICTLTRPWTRCAHARCAPFMHNTLFMTFRIIPYNDPRNPKKTRAINPKLKFLNPKP